MTSPTPDVGSPANAVELLCEVANQLSALIAELRGGTLGGGAEGAILQRVVAFTRPLPTLEFQTTSVGLTTDAKEILPDNGRRVSFTVLLSTGRLYRFADKSFSGTTLPEIDGDERSQFGIDGHIGKVYASADAATNVVVVQQFAPQPFTPAT